LFEHGANERRIADQFDAFRVQIGEQFLAGGIHEIDIGEIYYGPASGGGRAGGAPAEFQFADPGTRQAAFQIEAKFAGGVV
jgi:hypothetical protein